MSETNKIRFAVIGCGHIGKRHAAIIQQNPDGALMALCDAHPRETLGLETFSTIPFFADMNSLLQANIPIDVVTIASPNGFHEQHALQALDANKHIIIEKPMALTKAGCERIIYRSLQKHKQVFCVMQNRYSPPSVWLKNVVEEGVLGKIFIVQINCYWNRDDRYYKKDNWHGKKDLDGGILFTQFSHFIDLIYWCFGDIHNIQTRLNNFSHQHSTDFEDSGFVNFDFLAGGMGSIHFSTAVWDKNFESSITVIGEKGSLKIGGQYMEKVEYCHIKDYEMPELTPHDPPNNYGDYKGAAANHHFIIDNVVKVLRGESSITTNALEGMKVVDIIERIYHH